MDELAIASEMTGSSAGSILEFACKIPCLCRSNSKRDCRR
jgi:hypothetical protein